MNRSWIVAAKFFVVAAVAGTALWTVQRRPCRRWAPVTGRIPLRRWPIQWINWSVVVPGSRHPRAHPGRHPGRLKRGRPDRPAESAPDRSASTESSFNHCS
ncbi:hypothetical protein STENM327S_01631 [Streptomyces tendae]